MGPGCDLASLPTPTPPTAPSTPLSHAPPEPFGARRSMHTVACEHHRHKCPYDSCPRLNAVDDGLSLLSRRQLPDRPPLGPRGPVPGASGTLFVPSSDVPASEAGREASLPPHIVVGKTCCSHDLAQSVTLGDGHFSPVAETERRARCQERAHPVADLEEPPSRDENRPINNSHKACAKWLTRCAHSIGPRGVSHEAAQGARRRFLPAAGPMGGASRPRAGVTALAAPPQNLGRRGTRETG